MFTRTLTSWGRWLGLNRDSSTSEEERRVWGRLPCDMHTACKEAGQPGARSLPVRVKNVSPGGICLISSQEHGPGTLLSVDLPLPEEDGHSEILACVVRSEALTSEHWELGCTFASPLGQADLRRFATDPPRPVETDLRNWARFECRACATFQVVRSPEMTPPSQGQIVNISGGGLAMQVDAPLEVGDLLSIELGRDGFAVLTALASVVRCSVDRQGTRLVGCNFIQELQETHLRRLLA